MKNITIFFLAFIVLIPVLPINSAFLFITKSILEENIFLTYIWLLPAILYSCFAFRREAKTYKQQLIPSLAKNLFGIGFSLFAYSLTTLVFVLGFMLVDILNIGLANFTFFFLFFLLLQNVFYKSPGCFVFRLVYINDTFSKKIRIFLLNFYRILPIYLVLLYSKYNIPDPSIGRILMVVTFSYVVDASISSLFYSNKLFVIRILGLDLVEEENFGYDHPQAAPLH